ncbi:MAG: MATE family efflux transporter [Eubacteriales bacterium]|nr:MATE family efflux transporter [Eubacteriales bacterium]MDD3882310.1 MATE family efflux transporter [Eubacteriales bacterium]MDD4512056.1 MATE family efflux transporter [Eubacteriales bacterium]
MTEGSISKKIVLFALPIFLGNLFQQLYNVADSLIVGNYLGETALAAVSSSGSLIFMMIGFIQGVFIGAGVIISRHFGAKEMDKVHTAVHTTLAFGLAAGALLTVIGILVTPSLLRLMRTPENVLPSSIQYFRIYFAGSMGLMVYNTSSGIFQSMGDSRHPLYYLIISSVVNVLLDFLFVAGFGMGVDGAALATIISHFLSGGLAFTKLTRLTGPHRVTVSHIRFDKNMLGKILRLGLPTGVQNSVIAFANVIVQSNINLFGSVAMAGSGSYFKLEGFAFLPISSFCMALTTFIGQNLGAKKYDRAKRGARFGIISGVLLAELVGLVLYLFAPALVSLFNQNPDVVAVGVKQARTETLFYFLLALSHCFAGILRGAGKTSIPMYIMLVCWCVIRIIYISVIVTIVPDIVVIFWAYPITWSLSTILFAIYYFRADWLHNFDRQAARELAR